MDIEVSLAELVELVELSQTHLSTGNSSQPPFDIEGLLRTHIMQQWLTLSDPAMKEALHDAPLY